MSLQNEVLKIFENNREVFFSGQELATNFGVSRNAIWKVVQTLKEQGHLIESGTNKGYMLEKCSDVVSCESIEKYLVNKNFFTVEVVDEVLSTNAVLKDRTNSEATTKTAYSATYNISAADIEADMKADIKSDMKADIEADMKADIEADIDANIDTDMQADIKSNGVVLVARKQTAGRGRQGRSFYSPQGGVYFSVLLKPSFAVTDNTFLTALAGTAVAEAIEEISQSQTKIKWVNDILIDGKKVSGILTEAEIDIEDSSFRYIIVGIGINLIKPKDGFGSLDKIATSMFLDECAPEMASKLIARVLDKFFYYYTKLPICTFLNEYRKRQIVIGEDVELFHGDTFYKEGKVIDVNERCELVVRFDDGILHNISSGEARVKLKD